MGIFNNRFHNEAGEKEGRMYKILTIVALVGLFVAIGILVVGIMQNFVTAGLSLTLGIIATICLSIVLCLPWIKKLENNKYKTLSITFLAIISVCALLWIISCIVIFVMYKNAKNSTSEGLVGQLNFLKVVFILTIQFICSQTIATTVINYKKEYIVFQVIMYISNIFVDFYVTCVLLCVSFKGGTADPQIYLNEGFLSFLFTPAMYTLFALFLVYTAICSGVLNRIQKNKQKIAADVVLKASNDANKTQLGEVLNKDDAKARLDNIKEMLDSGLITQEEYDSKRAEILSQL